MWRRGTRSLVCAWKVRIECENQLRPFATTRSIVVDLRRDELDLECSLMLPRVVFSSASVPLVSEEAFFGLHSELIVIRPIRMSSHDRTDHVALVLVEGEV